MEGRQTRGGVPEDAVREIGSLGLPGSEKQRLRGMLVPETLARSVATEVMGWHEHDGRWCYSDYHHPIGWRVAGDAKDGAFRPDQSYFQVMSVVAFVERMTGATHRLTWKVEESVRFTFSDDEYEVHVEHYDGAMTSNAVLAEALLEYWRHRVALRS